MNCPICLHQGLSELALRCPKCESDLTNLHQINEIQEKYVENAKRRTFLEGEIKGTQKDSAKEISQLQRRSSRYLALFLLLPFIYKFCLAPKEDPSIKQKIQELAVKDSINAFKIQQYEMQVAELQQDTMALLATKRKSVRYKLTKGETLASLGIRFFNNKKAGYRIARDNRITASEYQELPVGKVLIINFR